MKHTKCSWTGSPSQYKIHCIDFHQPCSQCEDSFPASFMKEHLTSCPYRDAEICKHCHEKYYAWNKLDHEKYCRVTKCGHLYCDYRGSPTDLALHNRNASQIHIYSLQAELFSI